MSKGPETKLTKNCKVIATILTSIWIIINPNKRNIVAHNYINIRVLFTILLKKLHYIIF